MLFVYMRPGGFLEQIEPAADNGVAIVKQLAFYDAVTAFQGFSRYYI
mgnify:FL=1